MRVLRVILRGNNLETPCKVKVILNMGENPTESYFQMSVVEFLNAVEEPLKEKHLPLEKGRTIYTSLLGTAADLSPTDNVKASVSVSLLCSLCLVIVFAALSERSFSYPATSVCHQVSLFMETENIRVARERGFTGIFTTNANRLTQHISRLLDYEILSSVQVNQYEDENGLRPFAAAPDDLVTDVAYKKF